MATSSTTTTTTKTKLLSDSSSSSSSFPYEFGGPIGAFATTVILPVVVLLLLYWTESGSLILDIQQLQDHFLSLVKKLEKSSPTPPQEYFNCFIGLIGWFICLIILWKFLPGTIVQGVPILTTTTTTTTTNTNTNTSSSDKKKKDDDDCDSNKINNNTIRLEYKLNGHLSFWVVVGVVLGFQLPLNEYLFHNYETLAIVDIVICAIMSLILYIASYRSPNPNNIICAKGGNSGNVIYDFFMGRELNPRTYNFDWKVFCELRPGLIGWMLLNYSCLQEQYSLQGYASGSMILINIFQAIYVWDALYQERAILTTMDVTTDGFGYMLVFGDLAWVPFTYSVQAKYLVKYDPNLSTWQLSAILVLYLLGYTIFRSANGQKDIFRRNPNDPRVSKLQYLQTKRGTRLLTSGWWGMARKINYTGDYIMGVTWCLVCGFDSIVPYYYAIYFALLLIHRSIRDDEMCHHKYGDDWLEYKRLVPYRFIPGIF